MKKVVYTSIVGEMDELQQIVPHPDFDYICFVKRNEKHKKKIGVWKIMEIPFESEDNRTLSRFPKLQPHKVLNDYDCSLWIDGNVSIANIRLYDIINEKIEHGITYSGIKHWGRDCAYDEALGCLNKGKAKLFPILRTIYFLKKHHFPKHTGLYENNVIFRFHNDQTIKKFDDLWWDIFLKYVKRDQLSHPYAYLKTGIKFDYLLPKEFCTRNHPYFIYVKHIGNDNNQFEGFYKLLFDISRKTKVFIAKIFIKLYP